MVDIARRNLPVPRPGTLWRAAPAFSRFSLRANIPALASAAAALLPVAEEPCRSVQRGEWSALWLGPDEQLLIGPESQSVQFALAVGEALRGTPHSLVDVSHRQSGLEIHGPHSIDLLNAGCPLDLDLDRFPIGACTRTVMVKAEIVLWRRANEQFHVEVWRSL